MILFNRVMLQFAAFEKLVTTFIVTGSKFEVSLQLYITSVGDNDGDSALIQLHSHYLSANAVTS